MDGAVVVAERGGALLHARAFRARFGRRHSKSDRLNLAALLFALQSFAGGSLRSTDENPTNADPPIASFETAAERIVMARNHAHGLLFALFVSPRMDAGVARSLVGRIAQCYDYENGAASPLALRSNARLIREACEQALRSEIDARLRDYAALLYGTKDQNHPSASSGFVLLRYAPAWARPQGARQSTAVDGDDDDDDSEDDQQAPPEDLHSPAKESRLASPRPTDLRDAVEPASRIRALFTSARSLLPGPKPSDAGGPGQRKIKKNAVMSLVEPKHFEHFVLFPHEEPKAGGGDDALNKLMRLPEFPRAMARALEPHMAQLVGLLGLSTSSGNLGTGTWRHFPLPPLLEEGHVAVNLRFWRRGGCVLVHVDAARFPIESGSEQRRAAALLDRVVPLARCALKLSS